MGICSVCRGDTVIDDGELVCTKCGAVDKGELSIEEPLSVSIPKSASRAYSTTARATVMTNRDATGKKISDKSTERMRWLNDRVDVDTRGKRRSVNKAKIAIQTLRNKLNLNENIEYDAVELLKRVVDKRLLKGRDIYTMAIACMYISLIQAGAVRTVREVAEAGDVKTKHLMRCVRLIQEKTGIDVRSPPPRMLLPRLLTNLQNITYLPPEIKEKIYRTCLTIFDDTAENFVWVGKSPSVIAACMIRLVGYKYGLSITQADVAMAANVTTVSIRKLWKTADAELKRIWVKYCEEGAPKNMRLRDRVFAMEELN